MRSCCSCYDSCVKLNNCCIDKFWNRKNENMTLDSYFNEFVQIMNQNVSRYECNPIFESDLLSTIKGSSSEQYMMISTCLSSSSSSSSNEDDFMKCMSSNYTNMLQSLPVWSETTNDLYRSASCARCNNVQSYTPLGITLECKGIDMGDLKQLNTSECRFHLGDMETFDPYICNFKRPNTTCDNPILQKQCNAYIAPYLNSSNVHCHRCEHNIIKEETEYEPEFQNFRTTCAHASGLNYLTWSMTLDFSGKMDLTGMHGKGVGKGPCRSGEIHNIFTNECQQMECSDSYNTTSESGCMKNKENRITISKERSQENHRMKIYKKIQEMMVYIGSSISLVGYCSLIFTYLRFERLRNLSGLNGITFVFCLLVTDVLMLSSDKGDEIRCKIWAISTHYMILVSQMWATIICGDLAVAIHSITSRNKAKTFKKYLIIAFTVPLPFVITPMILNETGQVNVGYKDICWIQHFQTRLFSYILPIAAFYISSWSALSITFWKIHTTKKQTKKALESNRGHVAIVKIALKLIIGLGLIDIIGFVQLPGYELKEYNMILSMIFDTSRSLKGLFVCSLYLFNRKILDLYRGRISRNCLLYTSPSPRDRG